MCFLNFVFNARYLLCTFVIKFWSLLCGRKESLYMKSFMAENRKEMEQIKGLDVTQVCEKMHQSDVMLLELQLHKKDMAG